MNRTTKVLRAVFLLLAAAGAATWGWRTFGPGGDAAAAAGKPEPGAQEPEHLVVVTYFTTDQRCATCLTIEELTGKAVAGGFGEQLAAGELRFRTINFDRPENKRFIDRYELTFKTVVVSNRRHGEETEWAKFDEVWDLFDDPDAFAAYLQEGIRQYFEGVPDA